MDVPEGVTRVEGGNLYVRRPDGSWELSWPRSEGEERAGRWLTPLEEEMRRDQRSRHHPTVLLG